MDRRTALRALGLAVLAPAAGACFGGATRPGAGAGPSAAGGEAAGPTLPPPTDMPPRHRLPPVEASWDRVIRTTVGLRPYRPGGFVVRPERFDDTFVVHNYGHGGGGISLAWGSSALAVEQVLAHRPDDREVAVLGAGVMGLTTARLLQRAGRSVTLYARELPPHTTSNMSGGQWSPFSVFDRGTATPAFLEQFRRAAKLAHRHYQDFLGPGYGVRFVDNWFVADREVRRPDLGVEGVIHDTARVPPAEHPFPHRHALRQTTMFIEPGVFLRATLEDVRLAGGRVEVRELREPLEVVALPQRVVVNCTGLGARALFADDELIPVKGQLTFLVPQPEVDYIVIGGGLYMFPRRDGILLGGSFQRNQWSLEPDPDVTRRVVDGHIALFRGMKRRLAQVA